MNKLLGFLRRDLGTKITAVVMAGALWIYAYQTSTEDREIEVPIIIRTPADWKITQQSNASVKALVRLPARHHAEIRQVERNQELLLAAKFVPAEGAEPVLQSEFSIKPEMFEFPAEYDWLEIHGWQPEAVAFTAARSAVRELRVAVRSQEPRAGFRVQENPYVSPRTVMVEGPEWVLNKVQEIQTEAISIPPTASASVPVEGPFKIEQFVTVDGKRETVKCQQTVFVRLWLEQQVETVTLEKVKVNLVAHSLFPYVVRLPRDSEMNVVISGPKDVVASLTAENVLLYVNVNRLVPKDVPYTEQVRYVLEGVQNPEKIVVKLEKGTVPVDVREPEK